MAKIAGKGDGYPLQIRSNTWLMDLRLEKGEEITLPDAPVENCAFLFYVFDGKVNANDTPPGHWRKYAHRKREPNIPGNRYE